MASFKVYGADRASGAEVTQVIEAESIQEAEQIAHTRGLLVTRIEPSAPGESTEAASEPSADSTERQPLTDIGPFDEDERQTEAPGERPAEQPSAEPEPPLEPPFERPTEPAPPESAVDEPPLGPLADAAADAERESPFDADAEAERPRAGEPEGESEVGLPRESGSEPGRESPGEPAGEPAREGDGGREPAEPAEQEAEQAGGGTLELAEPTESREAESSATPPPAAAPPTGPPPAATGPRELTGAEDRWHTAWVAYLRISFGLLWLFELLLGRWWKLGATEGPHEGWLGAEAGSVLVELGRQAVEQDAAPWLAWLVQNTLIPHASAWSTIVVVLEFAIAVSLIFGLLVRPIALLALALSFVFINLGAVRVHPLFALAHLLMLASGGGRILSLDQCMLRRLRTRAGVIARSVAGFIQFTPLRRGVLLPLGGLGLLLALYHILAMPHLAATEMQVAYLEVALLLGLTGLALLAAGRGLYAGGLGDLVRIFLGFKLLQSIFMPQPLSVSTLPGWAGPEQLRQLFERIREVHWAPMVEVLDVAVMPWMAQWAAGFAIAQTLVGVMLLLGWRPRVAALLGVLLMVVLVVLGFVGLAPFVLVYMLFVAGAGSGRMLAIDAAQLQVGDSAARELARPLPWPRWAAVLTALAALVLLGFAGYEGLETGGYLETLPGFAATLLAIPLIALTLIAWPRPRDLPAPGQR